MIGIAPVTPPPPRGPADLTTAPPQSVAPRAVEPRPESAAPDSKAEYAPPRPLLQSQRTMLGLAPPVSVDVEAPPDTFAAPDGGLFTSQPPAAAMPTAPMVRETDRPRDKLDTIPPRSRRRQGGRGVVIAVMGAALVLVIAVVARRLFSSDDHAASESTPVRQEVVTAPPQGTMAPAAPADAPTPTSAATVVATPTATATNTAATTVEPPVAAPSAAPAPAAPRDQEPSKASHAVRHAAARPSRPAPAHTASHAVAPPPAPHGSIVRESPF
ncbi:MAG TPA: hypothetical protein VH142_00150 [Polyangiaceae bacterium]|nr:hypothetical protein [Polyangiaceae bacterium]